MADVTQPSNGLAVSSSDREVLESWIADPETAPRIAQRSRVVLMLASGANTSCTASTLGTTRATVRIWRDRFLSLGPAGLLRDKPGRGRKPVVPLTVWRAIAKANGSAPSNRYLAETLGISPATVARWRRRVDAELASVPSPADAVLPAN